MTRIPCLYLFLVSILCSTQVYGQFTERDFIRYGVKDGLTNNAITCMQQDDWGYIWIGTDEGLNRFDGNSFSHYFQATPPLQLLSGSISRLKRFGPHQLGILSKSGFQLLDTRTSAVRNFNIPDTTAFTTHLNAVWDAVELPDQSFAVTSAAGFYVFDSSGQLEFRYDGYTVKDIGNKRILFGRDIFKVEDQRLLMYVREAGMAEYDHVKKHFVELDSTDTKWNTFTHPRFQPYNHWVVKQQLSASEFVFIADHRDEVIYYNHAIGRKIFSPLPFRITDVFNWESRFERMNDSTLVINDRTNGFYIFQLNTKTGRIQCDGKKYLPGSKIISMLVDRDERLWVGTTEGLYKQVLQTPFIKAYHYPPAAGEKFTGGFSSIYRYKDRIYASRYSTNKGLVILDARDMRVIEEVDLYEKNSPWNEIRSIEMYHPDTLWLGTNVTLLWYDIKTGTYGRVFDEKKYAWSEYFYAILAPPRPDGYAWICGLLEGKVVRYHIPTRTVTLFTSQSKPALPFDYVKSIAYDAYGDVWIGGHSLARWNNKTQEFDTLITVYGGPHKFNDNIISLTADEDGSLWMHNLYNGILEYRIREKQFVSYTMKNGLPSDVLQSLSPVKHHALWMAGNNHIAMMDIRDKKVTIYGTEDGIPEQRPTSRLMYFDAMTGLFYLGLNEYILTFPYTPGKIQDYGSELLLQEITFDQDKTYYQPGEDLNIKYNENNLKIAYTIVDFEKSNYQFAYRLNPTEEWNPVGNQRSINLNNLSPGSYAIQIRAYGKPGVEKMASLFLVIHSPFWKTAWFIALMLLALAGGIYFLVRRRIIYIRQKANIDKLLSQTEMKALQAQMNPHFIFNSLNSIGEMILNNENQDASHYLSKFARLIRMTLDQSTQSLVSLRNTIEYLERYMEMENIRNNQFTHEVTVDDELDPDDTMVPPMLIQPFIENALWHGLPANRKDIHVRIAFKKEGENLVCTIDDNGIGIRQAQKNKIEHNGRHKSVGITNIQNRVDLLNEKYGLHGLIRVADKQDIPGQNGTGTRVTLQLPLEIKES